MKYPILSDEDKIIVHNRSKSAYNEFCTHYREIRLNEDLANRTIVVKSGYVNSTPLKKEMTERELDIDNIDYEIYKSIITINELHKYLNEHCNSEE